MVIFKLEISSVNLKFKKNKNKKMHRSKIWLFANKSDSLRIHCTVCRT